MNDDIPDDVKRQIIRQEIELYRNTRYQVQLRARVANALKADTQPFADEMVKIEQALDLLEEELRSLG